MEIQYIRVGDYFIPDLELPEEPRSIGKWGRMHRDYLRAHKPIQYNSLVLSSELWTYLADLNEQAQERLDRIIDQMKAAEEIAGDSAPDWGRSWAGPERGTSFAAHNWFPAEWRSPRTGRTAR